VQAKPPQVVGDLSRTALAGLLSQQWSEVLANATPRLASWRFILNPGVGGLGDRVNRCYHEGWERIARLSRVTRRVINQ
jgi:hypothetical protein